MLVKTKAAIYSLSVAILIGPILIFTCLCLFKLVLAILISDPTGHQMVTVQELRIYFVLAVIGAGGLYYLYKYIGPRIAADCKNYNMKEEKVHFRTNVGFIIASAFSGLGCFYLSMWIIPIQENNLLRFLIVYVFSFNFVFPKGYDVILHLLKKIRIIKDKDLLDEKSVYHPNLH